jgi:hypothetical protein
VMSTFIDTTFDAYSDTPAGRDPDSYSPTLRRYHQKLWSKRLPDGSLFRLSTEHRGAYLHHKSPRGEVSLSSDSIGHTYRYVKAMAPIIEKMPAAELDAFFSTCSTVGAYIIFPSKRVDGKPTINGARGLHWQIRDRFDLTLECIRRHYRNEDSPLSVTLTRYADFFELFGSFEGYANFFLLQDLVNDGGEAVKFFNPFESFDASPLWKTVEDYRLYKDALVAFITARNDRIASETA